jgi:hypothetical protein
MSTNPYLSMTELAGLGSLLDANEIAIVVGADNSQGSSTTVGSIPLSYFRDNYLLVTVNEQITALQNKPGNGAFASPVTMTVSGVVTGSATFDGSENFGLSLSMPANSIPISAVQDLASTLASLETQVVAPPQLESSYYSNLNGTSQTSILGYWNASSTNISGEDQYGTLLQLASDGSLGPSASNYVNQLLFGTNGTLNWRRNVQNGGWTLVSLWHSGNFNPSSYVQSGSTPSFAGLTATAAISGTSASFSGTVVSGTTSSYLAVGSQATGNASTYFRNDGTMAAATAGTPGTFYQIWNAGNFNPSNYTAALATAIAGGAANEIHYQSGPGVTAFTNALANAVLITSATNVPSLATTLPTGLTVPGMLVSSNATVSAAGTTQATATAIATDLTIVTTTAAGAGVVLPTGAAGKYFTVVNKGANSLLVYPASGAIIDGQAANAAITVPVNGVIEFWGSSNTQWYSTVNSFSNASMLQGVVPTANLGTGTASTGAFLRGDGTWSSTLASGSLTVPYVINTVGASSQWGQISMGATASAYLWGPGGNGDNIMEITRAASASYTSTFFGTLIGSNAGTGTALEAISSGSQVGFIVQDTGSNGANIKFIGNGSTTPNKTIRVLSGQLQFINSAYSGVITYMDDSGNWNISGSITVPTITVSGQINANGSSAIEATWPLATGGIANGGNGGNYGVVNHANNNGGSSSTSCAALTFIRDSNFGCYMGLDTDNGFKVGGWSFGNNAYQIAHAGLSSFTFAGTVNSVGVANFNTSDRRLKKNIKRRNPRPLHRTLKWYSYDRRDIDESGLGPLAQEVKNTEELYVKEYDHPLKDTGGKTIKRLTIDKSGIAMEESMWAGQEVDRLTKVLEKMEKRLANAEATIKRLKKAA